MSKRRQPQQSLLRPIHVFLSSPGDVTYERGLVRKIATELSAEPFLRNRAVVAIVSWDDPAAPVPMLADRTPQESVSRARRKPSECDVVVVVLWTRLGTPLPDEHRKADGGTYGSGTEWEYEDALRAAPRPDILVYQRTERVLLDPDEPEFAAKLAQRKRVKQFFARFRDADGSLPGGITKYDTPTAFAERLRKDLRELVAARLERPFRPSHGEAEVLPEAATKLWSGSPYPGLRAFTAEEAAIFFGRGREVDALVARLRDPAQQFLTVVGASGAGKFSLVHAGLLPRLADGAIEGSQHWSVLALTPGLVSDDPFAALAVELSRALPPSHARRPADITKALCAGR